MLILLRYYCVTYYPYTTNTDVFWGCGRSMTNTNTFDISNLCSAFYAPCQNL